MIVGLIVMAAAMTVAIAPQSVTPGEPLRISVTGVPADALVEGRFLDRDLHFLFAPGGKGRIAFTGVDLDIKPGIHRINVQTRGPEGRAVRRTIDLQVTPKEYPTERLKVSPKYVEPPPEVARRIARETSELKTLWRTATPDILFDGRVKRPLNGVLGRNFGRRRVFNDQPRSPHSGTDLSAATGTPVQASATGVVALAGEHYFSGNLVVLDHGGGIYTMYAHLSRIDVAPGDLVQVGSTLGAVGATGRVTGAHLHWGARVGGARVNPSSLLKLLLY